ncbi:MAG: neutral/alkaline non-lysosomal ceramidase N-terminal domain-containing protein [Chloroflexota bacterium]
MDQQFWVGAAAVEITPALGLRMDGYMARTGKSTGVHDPLTAAALVLEYGDRRAALITLDIMAISRGFTDGLRRDLAALLHTSPDSILICASHTHAAPSGLQDWSPIGRGILDHTLSASVHASIRQAVEQATSRLRPVRLRSAAGDVAGISGDRNRPERPVDQRVSVLAFAGEQGDPEAIIFHYACHPTILSADNLQYSADFPGAARQRIRERYPDAVSLFVNGAAANISTRFHRRDQSFAEVERLGRLLGDRVVELVGIASEDAPVLNWMGESVALPLREFPIEARQVESTGNSRIDTVRSEGAVIEATLREALQGRQSQQAQICALRLGSWTLLTVPGEAFNDLARSLREVSAQALIAGYTNDYLGYFPTQTAIDEATYEALSSAFDARAHALLQDRLSGLLHQLESI